VRVLEGELKIDRRRIAEVLDALKHQGLIVGSVSHSPPARSQIRSHNPNAEALTIWAAARPLTYTIAAEYLARRGIALQPPSLRYRTGKPALIAAVRGRTARSSRSSKPG
jgi:hypothetical protein